MYVAISEGIYRELESGGATTAEKLREIKVWVPTPGRLRPRPARGRAGGGCGRGLPPPAVGVRGCHLLKIFENSDTKSCIPVASALISGLRGRAYPSKQQECQGLNQFQNFNFSAVVAPLVVRTKNQSNGNYETCKLHATRHLGP